PVLLVVSLLLPPPPQPASIRAEVANTAMVRRFFLFSGISVPFDDWWRYLPCRPGICQEGATNYTGHGQTEPTPFSDMKTLASATDCGDLLPNGTNVTVRLRDHDSAPTPPAPVRPRNGDGCPAAGTESRYRPRAAYGSPRI